MPSMFKRKSQQPQVSPLPAPDAVGVGGGPAAPRASIGSMASAQQRQASWGVPAERSRSNMSIDSTGGSTLKGEKRRSGFLGFGRRKDKDQQHHKHQVIEEERSTNRPHSFTVNGRPTGSQGAGPTQAQQLQQQQRQPQQRQFSNGGRGASPQQQGGGDFGPGPSPVHARSQSMGFARSTPDVRPMAGGPGAAGTVGAPGQQRAQHRDSSDSPDPYAMGPEGLSPQWKEDLEPIVELISYQPHKTYVASPPELEMIFARTSAGQQPKQGQPGSQGNDWDSVWLQLSGTSLSMWSMKETRAAASQGTKVPPTYFNITESTLELLNPLPPPPHRPHSHPHNHVFSLNTAGSNRLLFSAPTDRDLVRWTTGLRLAAWERSRLEEIYTGHLIRAGRREPRFSLVNGRLEGWTRVRIMGGIEWHRLWLVLSDPETSAAADTPSQRRRHSLFGIGGGNTQSDTVQEPNTGVVMASFYNEPRTAKNRTSSLPVLSMTAVTQCYAVFPERLEVISQSNLMKVVGRISGSLVTIEGGLRDSGWALIMPEGVADETAAAPSPSPSLPLQNMMRWVTSFHDAFRLYGRPQKYSWDASDPKSLWFAYPQGEYRGDLFLNIDEASMANHRLNTPGIRALFTSLVHRRMASAANDVNKMPEAEAEGGAAGAAKGNDAFTLPPLSFNNDKPTTPPPPPPPAEQARQLQQPGAQQQGVPHQHQQLQPGQVAHGQQVEHLQDRRPSLTPITEAEASRQNSTHRPPDAHVVPGHVVGQAITTNQAVHPQHKGQQQPEFLPVSDDPNAVPIANRSGSSQTFGRVDDGQGAREVEDLTPASQTQATAWSQETGNTPVQGSGAPSLSTAGAVHAASNGSSPLGFRGGTSPVPDGAEAAQPPTQHQPTSVSPPGAFPQEAAHAPSPGSKAPPSSFKRSQYSTPEGTQYPQQQQQQPQSQKTSESSGHLNKGVAAGAAAVGAAAFGAAALSSRPSDASRSGSHNSETIHQPRPSKRMSVSSEQPVSGLRDEPAALYLMNMVEEPAPMNNGVPPTQARSAEKATRPTIVTGAEQQQQQQQQQVRPDVQRRPSGARAYPSPSMRSASIGSRSNEVGGPGVAGVAGDVNRPGDRSAQSPPIAEGRGQPGMASQGQPQAAGVALPQQQQQQQQQPQQQQQQPQQQQPQQFQQQPQQLQQQTQQYQQQPQQQVQQQQPQQAQQPTSPAAPQMPRSTTNQDIAGDAAAYMAFADAPSSPIATKTASQAALATGPVQEPAQAQTQAPASTEAPAPGQGPTSTTSHAAPLAAGGAAVTAAALAGAAARSSFAPSKAATERRAKAEEKATEQQRSMAQPGAGKRQQRSTVNAAHEDWSDEEDDGEEDEDVMSPTGEDFSRRGSRALPLPPGQQQQQGSQQQQQQYQPQQQQQYPQQYSQQYPQQYSQYPQQGGQHARPLPSHDAPANGHGHGGHDFDAAQNMQNLAINDQRPRSRSPPAPHRHLPAQPQSGRARNDAQQAPAPPAARQNVWNANFALEHGMNEPPKGGKFVELEEPSVALTKAFTPGGLLQAGMQDKQDRSAKRQEEVARETGSSLVNVPEKPPPPQTGLMGAVAAHERDRKQPGGLGATLTDRDRDRRIAEERQRKIEELQRQQMEQFGGGAGGPGPMGMFPPGGFQQYPPYMQQPMGYGYMSPQAQQQAMMAAQMAYQHTMMAMSQAGSQAGDVDGRTSPAASVRTSPPPQFPPFGGYPMGGMGGFVPSQSMYGFPAYGMGMPQMPQMPGPGPGWGSPQQGFRGSMHEGSYAGSERDRHEAS